MYRKAKNQGGYNMEWKTITEASNYEVSTNGQVRNRTTKKILKGRLSKNGYLQVSIKIDATQKFCNRYIHRLVALHFIQNPNNKREVNHIDGNKENNTLSNLEWVTSSENQKHRHLIGNKKTSNRHIGMFNKKGEMVKDFNSILEAVAYFNKTSRVNIDNALQGKQYTAYGYVWKYLD